MTRHGYFLPSLGAFGDFELAREAEELWESAPTGELAVEHLSRYDGAAVFVREDGTKVRRVSLLNFFGPAFAVTVRDL